MSCVYRRIIVGLYLMGFNVFSVASSGMVGWLVAMLVVFGVVYQALENLTL